MITSFLGAAIIQSSEYNGKKVLCSEYILSAFSLGDYIFILPHHTENVIRHEYGHCKQSLYLGWLYLIVIAIPSVLNNIYCTIARKFGKDPDYYNFYTEKWADNLVGIRRF